jgi:hypothetical protein
MGYAWLLAKAEQQHPVALEAVNMLAEEDADGLYEHAIRWAGANAPSLFERLGLSTSSVPKSARSILSDTVALSVARGPAVTLASMDARFAAYDYPMWDNANYFTGAMRVTGLVSPMGDALVFQSLMTGLGDGGISRTVAPFSPVLQSKGFLSRQSVLLPEEAIVRWNADNSTTYLLTGATRSASGEWAIDERAHGPVELTLRGSVCAVPLGFDIEDLTPE